MLDPLLERSGVGAHLDGVLSVDEAGIYKPSPRVYALATARLAPRAAADRVRVGELLGRDRREGVTASTCGGSIGPACRPIAMGPRRIR